MHLYKGRDTCYSCLFNNEDTRVSQKLKEEPYYCLKIL